MTFYSIKKATGFLGGYYVEGCVYEGWNFTLDGAKARIRKLKAADAWNEKHSSLGGCE